MSYVHWQFQTAIGDAKVMTHEEFAGTDLDKVLAVMSVEEKIHMLAGTDWWTTSGVPRLGVPHIKMSDGPNGVRGSSHFLPSPANCLPCGTAMGATFDPELIKAAADILARDAKAKGSSLLLAPTVNIPRNPLNGRTFEAFSEDPFLSGMLAAAFVDGLQTKGVGAVMKHFVCNEMEDKRFSASVEVGERAFREIYLMPFMIAQKLSKPWAYMTAYSRLRGVHCSENLPLLQGVLRDDWNFDGMIMSDWFGTYSTDTAINGGLDLEMPGPTRWRGIQTQVSLNSGKIELQTIDNRAKAVLKTIQRAIRASPETIKHNQDPEVARDDPDDRLLNRKLAAESIVLLKNSEGVLPLDTTKIRKILVTGPNARSRTVSGGGSAYLTSSYIVTAWDGIVGALEGSGIEVVYTPGCYGHRYLPLLDGFISAQDGTEGWHVDFFNSDPTMSASKPIASYVAASTRFRINDHKPEGLNDEFYLVGYGSMTMAETGNYNFGLCSVGKSRLFADDTLVVDNGYSKAQTLGDTFYGLGTKEETGSFPVVAGRTYRIRVEFTNAETGHKTAAGTVTGRPSLMLAALRVGGNYQLPDVEEAIAKAGKMAQECDAVICVTGGNLDWETEGSDRTQFALPGATDLLVDTLLQANDHTIICNISGSAFAFPWVGRAGAILQCWLAGNETGNAMADVLFGRVNPSGRMPLSFPHEIEHCTAHLNWGAENGKVSYGGGLFVGYRGYEATKRDPMFAFGEGLSYTRFEWSDFSAKLTEGDTADDHNLSLSISIRNTGGRDGNEVVQIYARDCLSSLRRPFKELKGFRKIYVPAGEIRTISIDLDKLAFCMYDDKRACWIIEKGKFEFLACRSARAEDEQARVEVEMQVDYSWTGL